MTGRNREYSNNRASGGGGGVPSVVVPVDDGSKHHHLIVIPRPYALDGFVRYPSEVQIASASNGTVTSAGIGYT